VQLAHFVAQVARVRATSKKTEKAAILADLLRDSGDDAGLAALYLCGVLPQGRIGIGWKTLEPVVTDAPAHGLPLALADVDAALTGVAGERGAGSAERRAARLRELFERASAEERRFLVELLMGEVRQGALEGVVQDAIARASAIPAADVRRASMFAPDLAVVAVTALTEGRAGLARFDLALLAPVAPMLASPAADVAAALERLGEGAFEYKVDGARVQVHKAGDSVRVFTRQLQDVTERVPEVVEWARAAPLPELIVEGEALALRADGRPQPFQVTMRRLGRSKDVAQARAQLPLSFYFFDCLYVAGEGSLVGRPYAERYERLAALAPDRLLPRIVTGDIAAAESFLARALDEGHEGLMAKALDAPYVAGQRGFSWLKLKSAHTLDLVVLAAEWGSGRRQGWLSNLHLGARDPGTGGFVMLGKTFKGLTDALLEWQTRELLARETRREGHMVFVRPELVVEIAFGDVQHSPRYPGGMALRFARVKRYREDKRPEEADTVDTVRAIQPAAEA
jgi:DNA ligase-1